MSMTRPQVRSIFLSMRLAVALMQVSSSCASVLLADGKAAKSLPLIKVAQPGSENRLTPSSDEVSVTRSTDAKPGLIVSITPGKEGYPGVKLKPEEGKAWDLSQYGHVDARVTNTGKSAVNIALRVDNDGDWHHEPWNTESATIEPGKTQTITVIFGYSYGHQPGFALDSKSVVGVMLFSHNIKDAKSFRVESIEAAGPAGEKP